MKKTILILSAALVLGVAPVAAEEIMRSFSQQIPVGDAEEIALYFPVGEVTVEAWDNPQVNLNVQIACHRRTSRCEEAAKAVRLVYNTSGDRLRVEVKSWPKMSGGKGMHVIAKVSEDAADLAVRLRRNRDLVDCGQRADDIDGTAHRIAADELNLDGLGGGVAGTCLRRLFFRTP